VTNRFAGVDNPGHFPPGNDQDPGVFGIVYTQNFMQGNISGPAEVHGEVFEIDPSLFTFNVPVSGYTPDYVNLNNYLLPNPLASVIWRVPTEAVPFTPPLPLIAPFPVPGPVTRFIGSSDRATSTGVLDLPGSADRSE
jgi:hypothetical protein